MQVGVRSNFSIPYSLDHLPYVTNIVHLWLSSLFSPLVIEPISRDLNVFLLLSTHSYSSPLTWIAYRHYLIEKCIKNHSSPSHVK